MNSREFRRPELASGEPTSVDNEHVLGGGVKCAAHFDTSLARSQSLMFSLAMDSREFRRPALASGEPTSVGNEHVPGLNARSF